MINLDNPENIDGTTVNKNIKFNFHGVSQLFIDSHETLINPVIGFISKQIDVSSLYAICFSDKNEYEEAINSVDRGFIIENRITPSSGSEGMALALNKNGGLKVYIVFNVSNWQKIIKNGEDMLDTFTISAIAHEMAHVEIMENLHKYQAGICYPSYKFGKDAYLKNIPKTCVEEYIACYKTSFFDKTESIKKSFEKILVNTVPYLHDKQALLKKQFISGYISYDEYIQNSYDLYLNIFLYLSYYLGSNYKKSVPEAIKKSPFYVHLKQIKKILKKTHKEYPDWKNSHPFQDLQILLEKIVTIEAEIVWAKNIWGYDYCKINF